ncbi:S8 family peptidase [Halorussus halophilus]|uniref:S8 family peptidase n=1 Tax=Halorussus halophilus TaxID=2650975 RepID=UPI001300CCAD|nr:S8 family peptidase [Halorussus halophilus]
MSPDHSRRTLLKSLGGAAGVAATSGLSSATAASDTVEVNIGYQSRAGRNAAEQAATAVVRRFNFDALTIEVAPNALDGLRNRPDIRYVERNGTMRAIHHKPGHDKGGKGGGGGGDTSQTLPWGIDRVDADVAAANGETGTGADVAIIDTGIDGDHPDLQANVGTGKAFVNCRGRNCNNNWSDDNDHGTHCAGIAAGIDNSRGVVGIGPDITLHAVKVLDKSGSGSFSDVAAGIQYTADQGWDVGSMSLGASSGSQTVKDACGYAANRGVLLVAAAGNSGPCTDCVGYPAAYEECIAVSATTSSDSLASFSSTGPEVELAAPGAEIYSTVVGGYDTFNGTSMACPHVSGAGGQLMANGASNTQARNELASSAEDIGLASNEQGNGLLDVASALGLNSSDD